MISNAKRLFWAAGKIGLLLLIVLLVVLVAPGLTVQREQKAVVQRKFIEAPTYSKLILEQTQTIHTSYGLKSVLFNSSGSKLYALNLEAMRIYEFSQASKKMVREIVFSPTKAKGIDYSRRKPMSSFAEKPVEACFSHQDRILWVSLHNAGGVVPIFLDAPTPGKVYDLGPMHKLAFITDLLTNKRDTISFPLIRTGETPKVIAKTADDNYLLVSNWSSKSVSILKINDTLAPYGRKIATVATSATPRGITINNRAQKSYVAIMGNNTVSVIDHKKWKIENTFIVPTNPRHLVADTASRLFISFNELSKIACLQQKTGEVLFVADTERQPRTIALSKNQRFLFVTCYGGDTIDIFEIKAKSFKRIYSLSSDGKPIGITLYEDDDQLEAWVCNFVSGSLKVFTFKKSI